MGGGQDYVENPNANYMNGRGFWAFYVLLIVHFHLTLLTLPIITFTVPWVRNGNLSTGEGCKMMRNRF